MKVRWTAQAQQHRAQIRAYIAAHNRSAARRMHEVFNATAASLALQPMMGKPGEIPGTREYIVHPSYRMVYRIIEDTLWIVTLINTAQEWPPVRE
jgi:addiction module RelE/StbE family toxin